MLKRKKTITTVGLLLALALGMALAPQADAAQPMRVQIIGDSLSSGTYPGYLYGLLSTNLSEYEWTMKEHALSGYTTGMILSAQTRGGWRGEYPDVVIILAGTNDMVRAQGMDLDDGTNTAVANVQTMVDIATWENTTDRPRVIVSAIPPSWYYSITVLADYYNQRLADELENFGVDVFVKSNFTDFQDTTTWLARTDIFADYLHPTDQGYQDMAFNFYEAVDALVHKDRYVGNKDYKIMPNYKKLP